MVSFLLSLLALSPAATLVSGAETDEIWSVQRLQQVCGKGGCYQEFYVSGQFKPWPEARAFDSYCTGLGFEVEWKQCRSQLPYSGGENGGFAKINPWNETSKSFEVWFSRENFGSKKNETGRMEVESTWSWDVGKCRQMTVISKENL